MGGGTSEAHKRERERERESGGDISSKSPEAIPGLHQQCSLDVSALSTLVFGLCDKHALTDLTPHSGML